MYLNRPSRSNTGPLTVSVLTRERRGRSAEQNTFDRKTTTTIGTFLFQLDIGGCWRRRSGNPIGGGGGGGGEPLQTHIIVVIIVIIIIFFAVSMTRRRQWPPQSVPLQFTRFPLYPPPPFNTIYYNVRRHV